MSGFLSFFKKPKSARAKFESREFNFSEYDARAERVYYKKRRKSRRNDLKVVACFYYPDAKNVNKLYLPHYYFPPHPKHKYWAIVCFYGSLKEVRIRGYLPIQTIIKSSGSTWDQQRTAKLRTIPRGKQIGPLPTDTAWCDMEEVDVKYLLASEPPAASHVLHDHDHDHGRSRSRSHSRSRSGSSSYTSSPEPTPNASPRPDDKNGGGGHGGDNDHDNKQKHNNKTKKKKTTGPSVSKSAHIRASWKAGTKLDVKDDGVWYGATIRAVNKERGTILIAFEGFDGSYDKWISRDSLGLAPYGRFSTPPDDKRATDRHQQHTSSSSSLSLAQHVQADRSRSNYLSDTIRSTRMAANGLAHAVSMSTFDDDIPPPPPGPPPIDDYYQQQQQQQHNYAASMDTNGYMYGAPEPIYGVGLIPDETTTSMSHIPSSSVYDTQIAAQQETIEHLYTRSEHYRDRYHEERDRNKDMNRTIAELEHTADELSERNRRLKKELARKQVMETQPPFGDGESITIAVTTDAQESLQSLLYLYEEMTKWQESLVVWQNSLESGADCNERERQSMAVSRDAQRKINQQQDEIATIDMEIHELEEELRGGSSVHPSLIAMHEQQLNDSEEKERPDTPRRDDLQQQQQQRQQQQQLGPLVDTTPVIKSRQRKQTRPSVLAKFDSKKGLQRNSGIRTLPGAINMKQLSADLARQDAEAGTVGHSEAGASSHGAGHGHGHGPGHVRRSSEQIRSHTSADQDAENGTGPELHSRAARIMQNLEKMSDLNDNAISDSTSQSPNAHHAHSQSSDDRTAQLQADIARKRLLRAKARNSSMHRLAEVEAKAAEQMAALARLEAQPGTSSTPIKNNSPEHTVTRTRSDTAERREVARDSWNTRKHSVSVVLAREREQEASRQQHMHNEAEQSSVARLLDVDSDEMDGFDDDNQQQQQQQQQDIPSVQAGHGASDDTVDVGQISLDQGDMDDFDDFDGLGDSDDDEHEHHNNEAESKMITNALSPTHNDTPKKANPEQREAPVAVTVAPASQSQQSSLRTFNFSADQVAAMQAPGKSSFAPGALDDEDFDLDGMSDDSDNGGDGDGDQVSNAADRTSHGLLDLDDISAFVNDDDDDSDPFADLSGDEDGQSDGRSVNVVPN
jgi:hypothetical protein